MACIVLSIVTPHGAAALVSKSRMNGAVTFSSQPRRLLNRSKTLPAPPNSKIKPMAIIGKAVPKVADTVTAKSTINAVYKK